GSISDVIDLSSTTDSDTSGVSFRPNFNTTDNSDSREALNLTELITPESAYLPDNCSRPLTYLNRSIRCLADTSTLPNFSDNPNNDIDKDIINVLLNYRRAFGNLSINSTSIYKNGIELPLKREVEGYYIFYKINNIINGRESNKSLIRAITRISRWIDKRRPRYLTLDRLERALRRKLSGATINNEETKKRRSGKEETLLWLRSPDTIVFLKVGYYLKTILRRLRSLADIFNIIVTPNFLYIAVRRNIANISRLYVTFERSTYRIEGVIYMTKIYYIRYIFVGIQKRFIALALNGITTPKKIRDQTLIPINW
ncbi:hypothetical protein N7530_010451, partial [Penicillium desertorum]